MIKYQNSKQKFEIVVPKKDLTKDMILEIKHKANELLTLMMEETKANMK
jgi:hypothetical protein